MDTITLVDYIEKQVTVKAPKERVFAAISDPKQIINWFPDSIVGELIVGEQPIIEFTGYGKYQIYVAAVDPYDYFAYRWVPDNGDGTNEFLGDVLAVPNTLVEFRLESVPGGTTVKVKESGISSLPGVAAEKTRKNNAEGWDEMLGRLEKLMSIE